MKSCSQLWSLLAFLRNLSPPSSEPTLSQVRNQRWKQVASRAILLLILRCWRWKRRTPPKHRLAFNVLHDVISQKIEPFITTSRLALLTAVVMKGSIITTSCSSHCCGYGRTFHNHSCEKSKAYHNVSTAFKIWNSSRSEKTVCRILHFIIVCSNLC
jgi:hypothetical protein